MANTRRHDLDNLRTSLTALVIVHHTALAYGGPIPWPLQSALVHRSATITAFVAFNQSFFMGLFFWISGRGSSQSLARIDCSDRTRWSFVKAKCLRLGLPTVVYTLFVEPTVLAMSSQWTIDSFVSCWREYYSGLNGVRGPVWYLACLLAMDMLAAVFMPFLTATRKDKITVIPHWYVLAIKYGWLVVAGVSFAMRLRYPIGTTVPPLLLQPGFAPQYIFSYIMGLYSSFTGPSPRKKGDGPSHNFKTGLLAASLVSFAGFFLMWNPFIVPAARLADTRGGWNSRAMLYAFWNEASFALVSPALVNFFATKFNSPVSSGIFQARYSYAAFLFHMLVCTAFEICVERLLNASVRAESSAWQMLGPAILTASVGAANVCGSFALAKWLMVTFPTLSRII